jgi:prepilin-type N-terminal cleavage/methylation domain-containing protein
MHRADWAFTLIEMVIVIAVIGILLTVSLPFFRSANLKSDLRASIDAIASMHATAKAAAIQRGRLTRLVLSASASQVFVVANKAAGTGVDTVGLVENLGSRFGVTFTSTRDTLTFTPRGVGTELSGTTIIVSKSSLSDTITISAAGRLTR